MVGKYVPPHLRNGNGSASTEVDHNASGEKGGQGRFERGKDGKGGYGGGYHDGGKGGKASGNPPEAEQKKSTFSQMQGAGGDWSLRFGSKRRETQSEEEVFGPAKTRSTSGIDFDKYDAIPVQVTGENCEDVKPIVRFSEAKLVDSLFDNLRRCGYDRPTPVQKYSIPIVLSGRDLMACAQTGSGKTCAFMVPCLESLLRSGPPPNNTREHRPKPKPCGLCLAPTRELAVQIQEESKKFAFDTGIRCCIINGGTDMREQRSELEGGCDVLVATPGRLTDMFERTFLSLGSVQFFILDEADRMLDMGFEPQVRQIVKNTDMGRQAMWSTVRLQSMMFSATFAREVQVMARDFLNDYLFIKVGRDHLPNQGLCVVFVETKRGADSLEMDLHQRNVSVAAIHGDRTQTEREEALAAFKSGANPILVATDVAARGLDIPNVSLVVNFDMPKQLDDYVHRIGRTGRKGTAVAFVNEKCSYLHDLYDILVEAKQETPLWFEEMIRSARRMGGKGSGASRRRDDRFGGSDIRSEEAGKAKEGPPAASLFTKGPPRVELPVGRSPDAFGTSGLEDAW
eukprot:Skav229458  [mRNA]  locus=scaffold397:351920:354997:+ [translate_table: standard]